MGFCRFAPNRSTGWPVIAVLMLLLRRTQRVIGFVRHVRDLMSLRVKVEPFRAI